MYRLLLALALSLHLMGSGGSALELEQDGCSENCPDDGGDGSCPPGSCAACVCCSHLNVALPFGELKLPPMPPVHVDTEWVQAETPAPDADEILHVPKTRFA